MAKLWAEYVMNGNRNFDSVPRLLKSKVRKILEDNCFEISEDET